MKKQLIFVSAVLFSLVMLSCQNNSNRTELDEDLSEVDQQFQQNTQEIHEDATKSFEELKLEAAEATRKAKEKIQEGEKEAATTFKDFKKEAEEATHEATKN